MTHPVRNQDLIKAVEQLKRLRVVKRDKDIVAKTGYSKGIVSSYLSGKSEASEKFLEKFYKVYGAELNKNYKTEPEQNQNPTDLYDYEIPLTEGKRAILRYPKGEINHKDVAILKTVMEMIGMTIGELNNPN